MIAESVTVTAALALAARSWPVLPVRPRGKDPLTRHGVKNASTDPDLIRAWFARTPDANLAVATGAPGPQVLDVDDLAAARDVLARLHGLDAPTVATSRGRHVYFTGQPARTIDLEFGELRGQGSYVVCPPSIHPDGREYVWLLAPTGPLSPVPPFVGVDGADGAGRGEHAPPPAGERVPFGARHPYLRDFAVRLLRAGITDPRRLEAHLRLEFELSCEPSPAPAPGDFAALAAWAADSRLAGRERSHAEFIERWRTPTQEPPHAA